MDTSVDAEENVGAETTAVVVGKLCCEKTEADVVKAAVAAEIEDDEEATAEGAAFA